MNNVSGSPGSLCLLQDGTEKAKKVFISVQTEVGQTEAEEIGKCMAIMHVYMGIYLSHGVCSTIGKHQGHIIQLGIWRSALGGN